MARDNNITDTRREKKGMEQPEGRTVDPRRDVETETFGENQQTASKVGQQSSAIKNEGTRHRNRDTAPNAAETPGAFGRETAADTATPLEKPLAEEKVAKKER